jgi:U6 snRNA-associated Sm-like protein LSm6
MDDSPREPSEGPPPSGPPQHTGSPTEFLKGVVGKRVIVRLISGVDYKGKQANLSGVLLTNIMSLGILSCLDGFMNIALEQTEEHVNGVVTNRYGDAFVRGNNGQRCSLITSLFIIHDLLNSPLHICGRGFLNCLQLLIVLLKISTCNFQ